MEHEINFNLFNSVYLKYYVINVNDYKINERFYFFFHNKSLKNSPTISQFEPAPFQVLSGHMWLVSVCHTR